MASTTRSHSSGLKEWTGSVFTISPFSLFPSIQNSSYLLPSNCFELHRATHRFAGPPLVPGVFCGTSVAQNRPWSFQQVTLCFFLMIGVSISSFENILSFWGHHYELPFGPNNTSSLEMTKQRSRSAFDASYLPGPELSKRKLAARGLDLFHKNYKHPSAMKYPMPSHFCSSVCGQSGVYQSIIYQEVQADMNSFPSGFPHIFNPS